ncbi:carbohydrate ABC transporter permease [Caldanaerobius polysaccharolyticus]|uniref:carbohydrate ABC transporter permease n=1 Tax=Caldanaerobius polysaccharolyticus TaxID=44256 RepID=UPI0004799D13|nr:sugar ABC transporter permease [Caldanaerobius polysaccharolyticus]
MKESRRNMINGLLFISPWIVGFMLFTLYPILSSFYYSLTDYNVISSPKFVGLQNYIQLFKDGLFYTSLYNTLYMIVFGVTLTMITTLIIAIALNDKRLKRVSFFRVIFFIPTLVPTVILSILWIWLLQPDNGLVNTVLNFFHIPGPGWFASLTWSKPAFILMAVWAGGNYIIIFLAGLQDIPQTLYEAVDIDGGTTWHKIWYVTLPMLKPVILFNVITAILNAFQSFAEAFIITQGGPNNSTNFYALYLYQNAFLYQHMGYASAMAWIMLVITLVLTMFLLKTTSWGKVD